MSRPNLSSLSSMNCDAYVSTIERRLNSSPTRLRRDDYSPRGTVALLWDDDWLAAHTERDADDPDDVPGAELCFVGAAGVGKTRGVLEWLHDQCLTYPRCRVLLAREYREQLTQSVMVTLRDEVFPEGTFGGADSGAPIRFHGEEQAYIYPNGSRMVLKGLRDSRGIYSQQYDHVFVNEVDGVQLGDWEQLQRAKRNRRTPYSLLIGDLNPQHELHWMHQRCDAGVTIELEMTHADNPAVTAGYLRGLEKMSGARLERLRYGRRVIDVEGSYYGRLLHEAKEGGRLGAIRPDPARTVDVSWDLGVADFTVLWFWQAAGAGQHWAIDYYEMSGEGLAHFARVLQRKRERFGYVYGTFYLPHDVEQRVQAFEVETRLDIMRRLFTGIRLVVVPRVVDVAERIEAMRNLIPRACFDTSKAPADDPEARNTAQGMQRLIAYKREYHEALGTFAARPKHDEASHAADAAGTYAQGYGTGIVEPLPEARVVSRPWQQMGARRR